MNQNKVKKAYILLNYFVRRVKSLYGLENMLFNLHGHIHLAVQALNWGPLHKLTCFPFEGMFKIGKSCVHGTRGFANQMHEYFTMQRLLSIEMEHVKETIVDHRIANFLLYSSYNGDTKTQFKSFNCSNYSELHPLFSNLISSTDSAIEKQVLEKKRIVFANKS